MISEREREVLFSYKPCTINGRIKKERKVTLRVYNYIKWYETEKIAVTKIAVLHETVRM